MIMRIGQTQVQHKSGGPDMVIAEINGDMITVRWWDEEARVFKKDVFNKAELRDGKGWELK